MAELLIRKAEARDVDGIAALEEICFATPWSRESVEHDICGNKLAFYLVADLEGRVVGYAGIWNIIDEGHITNVAVSPAYRKQHIGTILVNTLIEATERAGIVKHTLEVRRSNMAAINLYKKFDFFPEGIRPGYYEDNHEDAVIMWRDSKK